MATDRREPPRTAEGWYVLHDFRTVDWDAWREAPARRREEALGDAIEYLAAAERVDDAEAGDSAAFAVLGHEADLLVVHLRPTLAELNVLERRFEHTAFAGFTDRTDSYVSVTEASGYSGAEAFFDPDREADPGIRNYIESRLYPEIPDAEYVSFYPMDKRRDPEYNWYDTPFDERAEYMSSHGEIGKSYAGKVSQIISSSVGLDDHEWGVTLFADDPTDVKDIIYEMRFDPASSRFAEFGRFRLGRRFPPANLGAYLAGEPVPREAAEGHAGGHPPAAAGGDPHGSRSGRAHASGAGREHGGEADGYPHGEEVGADDGTESDSPRGASGGPHDTGDGGGVRDTLAQEGVYAGQPHGEDVHAVVLYSEADVDELFEEVDGLRTNFDHYDTHVKTAVYEPEFDGDGDVGGAESDATESAVVSLWETERAASTAAGFLAELPGIVRQAGDDGVGSGGSWGTMGMFYTTKPEHREDFVGTFAEVVDLLAEMDGHRKSDLLVNREDENDMFIASRWDSREDAMAFFRSDAFADTVEYGRDVLADRPRHVFLA